MNLFPLNLFILIGISQLGSSSAPPPASSPMTSAINSANSHPVNGVGSGVEAKKDAASAPSNLQPQYAMPPHSQQNFYQPAAAAQFHPQYLMQPNPGHSLPPPMDNSLSEMRSDISSLRDTVLLLSNVVKQNAMATGRAQDDRSAEEDFDSENQFRTQGRNAAYQPNSGYSQGGQGNYGPTGNNYDAAGPIQIEVYQSKKGYKQPPPSPPPPPPKKEEKKPAPILPTIEKKLDLKPLTTGLTNLFPSLIGTGRTSIVSRADRVFSIIKRGMKNALVTGLIVALVKLAPLIWVGLRLIFNAILPLVGISLLDRPAAGHSNHYNRGIIASDPAPTVVASDTTQAPPSLMSNDVLDDELSYLESSFDMFKGKLY